LPHPNSRAPQERREGEANGVCADKATCAMAIPGKPLKIGKYDVVEVLGEGGMGAVYKAIDPLIGRTVAIKVIKGDFAQDAELRRRFNTEARAVGNLQHPNIVTVFDFGEENGSPYLVMQFLDGTPLDKVIAQRQNSGVKHSRSITSWPTI